MSPLAAALARLAERGSIGDPFLPGMRVWLTDRAEPVRLVEGHAVRPGQVAEIDTEDPATTGCLMRLLEEALGGEGRWSIHAGDEIAAELIQWARL